MGDRFAAALISKAQEGVPVRLIVDRQGSDPERGSREFYEQLTQAGIQVCVTRATQPRVPRGPLGAGGETGWNLSGLGHIDHRKVVVVDGRIGWVGGAGIEDHFENGAFHDLFVRVEGPVVAQLQLVFVASLRWLGGEIPAEQHPGALPDARRGPEPRRCGRAPQRAGSVQADHDAIAALIDGAQDTLDVVNPYVTDRGMIGRIVAAAHRGARVRLFVPANPNNWACGAAEQFHHKRLIEAGVQILGYPKMLHAKAFVADGEQVLVGTCNLEAWSLRRFFEIDSGSCPRISRRSSTSSSSLPPRRSARTCSRLRRLKERGAGGSVRGDLAAAVTACLLAACCHVVPGVRCSSAGDLPVRSQEARE